ncbi:MAG: oxidoreductase domain protein [Myxococcales bacterium]|nr:oxidoreductase domain protein [Myxococcales bacterium]
MAKPKVRFAVVGQGHFAQKAVLPAFKHAKNAELTALVSSDPKKLRKLAKTYAVEHTVDYDGLDALCREDAIDAVYIVTPNHTHRAFTERVAPHGIHVLCEKPMAVTEEDCEAMIRVCADNGCKLMIGYRLHFEEANLKSIDLVRKGKLGEPRFFTSSFSFQVHDDNIRVGPRSDGGGPLYDIGAYCINAARYLFGEEPTEVFGMGAARKGDPRFSKVEEQVSAVLRFSNERLATFTVSFGAAATGSYQVVGEKGVLTLDPAYEYEGALEQEVILGEKKPKKKKFKPRDQIGPEISYFADCILNGKDPEPSGKEGLADVRVIRAIYRSIDEARPVRLDGFDKGKRPTLEQERSAPPQRKEPPIINARPES